MTAPAPTLVFAGSRPPRRLLILSLLLVLSALAHAVSFYILQVAYTPTVTLAPPPAEVTLLAPGSPENRALDRWLSITDPSLMTNPTGAGRDLNALTFRYVPSYASAPPAYRPLDLTPAVTPPAAGNIFSLAPLPPLKAPPRAPRAALPSSVALDASLAALAPQPLPPVRKILPAGGSAPLKPLEPTGFLVGARADGGPPFIFRESSSGNAAADESARDYLRRLPLAPAGPAAPWGRATFFWGADGTPLDRR